MTEEEDQPVRPSGLLAKPVLWPILIPLCLLLLCSIALFPFVAPYIVDESRETDRITVPSSLSYVYKRDGVIHEQTDGDLFRPGDALQIFYSSEEQQYLTLFSVNAHGNVSFYPPVAGADTVSILAGVGKRLAYPKSVVIDSANGPQLVVALFTPAPLDTATIRQLAAGFRPATAAAISSLGDVLANRLSINRSAVAMLVLNKSE